VNVGNNNDTHPGRQPGWLLWLIGLVKAVLVIGFVGYLFYGLVFSDTPSQSKSAQILKVLSDEWKALVFLTILVFHSPIGKFLSDLQSVNLWGAEAKRSGPIQTLPNEPEKKS